jgi:Domain of unknown function (DUF4383)
VAKVAHRLLISELDISLAGEKGTAMSREMSSRRCTRLYSRGLTTNYSSGILVASFRCPAARHFQVSILHNIGHLLFGVAGLLLVHTVSGARSYLVWGGLLYLVF